MIASRASGARGGRRAYLGGLLPPDPPALICFDVLEHIYISDLKNVLSDLYYHASKIVVLQVACYEAKAKLPNGENAHITIRNPLWWKGFIDSTSSNFGSIKTVLICSTAFNKASVFKTWSLNEWNENLSYKVDL